MSIKNIMYIGPYKEESNRGYYSYMNIKALERAGHNIKTIPVFSCRYLNNKISNDIVHLENNTFDKYDICIQHCDALQYTYNSCFEKNIGIFDFVNFDPNPIVNSRLVLLDKIVVNSKNKVRILQETLSAGLHRKLIYSPQLIDLDNKENSTLEWTDKKRFYFYAELDFSEQYDWEKLIYIYLTNFMDKQTGLTIKTKKLDSQKKIDLIKKQIYDMASEAKVKPISESMPNVLNGVYDKKNLKKIYNTANCYIDVNKANEPCYAAIHFAATGKPLICNKKLTTASYFKNSIKVDGLLCNSSMVCYDDIMNNCMNNYYYSMNAEELASAMIEVYKNRYNSEKITYEEIKQHEISNINNLL